MKQSPESKPIKSQTKETVPATPRRSPFKWILLLALVVIGAGLFWKFGDQLSLDQLAKQETELRDAKNASPMLVYPVALFLYIIVTGLSLPGAGVMSLVYAWYFGFWPGLVLVSFASTAGATIAFLLSRFFFQDAVQNKFGERIQKFNQAFQDEGPFYLFSLRLIPVVPFFIINLVMGLTPIRVGTFWWVSQAGMLPGTAAYVYAGSQFPSLQILSEKGASGIVTPGLLIAFAILGLMPLTLKKLVLIFQKQKNQTTEPT